MHAVSSHCVVNLDQYFQRFSLWCTAVLVYYLSAVKAHLCLLYKLILLYKSDCVALRYIFWSICLFRIHTYQAWPQTLGLLQCPIRTEFHLHHTTILAYMSGIFEFSRSWLQTHAYICPRVYFDTTHQKLGDLSVPQVGSSRACTSIFKLCMSFLVPRSLHKKQQKTNKQTNKQNKLTNKNPSQSLKQQTA